MGIFVEWIWPTTIDTCRWVNLAPKIPLLLILMGRGMLDAIDQGNVHPWSMFHLIVKVWKDLTTLSCFLMKKFL
jgi:hypothetical protein